MSVVRRKLLVAIFRRFVAVGGIGLVLLLTALTASPELHHWFHGQDDAGADDGCAVVQFAQGVSVAVDQIAVVSTPAVWHFAHRLVSDEILLASPRYLHQPERGPPVS
ncbi:MAG: hypothetical protein JWM35_665 [Verrucomicrobia bacterium]|nr:hypothetical protein [Verrucomicrobiota bacterium]